MRRFVKRYNLVHDEELGNSIHDTNIDIMFNFFYSESFQFIQWVLSTIHPPPRILGETVPVTSR